MDVDVNKNYKIDELRERGLITEQRYLNEQGRVFYREKVAGKTNSAHVARLTGFTPEYIRQIIGGFMPVTANNSKVLEAIEHIAASFAESYVA